MAAVGELLAKEGLGCLLAGADLGELRLVTRLDERRVVDDDRVAGARDSARGHEPRTERTERDAEDEADDEQQDLHVPECGSGVRHRSRGGSAGRGIRSALSGKRSRFRRIPRNGA